MINSLGVYKNILILVFTVNRTAYQLDVPYKGSDARQFMPLLTAEQLRRYGACPTSIPFACFLA